ncbi:S41 family peptidase [Algoriphagus sp. Y33]|uniref:S41 family peptidase n=1 Tax=Algoriphagus sp. Y33 TaxID=2772483 RepID=UPI0017803A84|nr:S41 family peptidase [Algoriphagus sp. Y33]
MKSTLLSRAFFFLILSGLLWSCDQNDDQDPVVDPDITLEEKINNWIYDVMDEVYYWRDNLGTPIAATSDPTDYFESLLYLPGEVDRFSIIYPDYQELINSLSGISLDAGYEFKLFTPDNELVYAEVIYVKKNSPASSTGLKRGDVIEAINGTILTINNYRNILSQTATTHTISPLRYNEESLVYEPLNDISLTPVQLSENPNFLDTVYTINNQKIGYLVYNFFAPGTSSDETKYDREMDAIFEKMKAENINNLILDLRYNGGGYVSSAVNLASLIGPVTSSDIFSKTKYNSLVMSAIPSLSNVQTAFLTKSQNLGNTLAGNRLYVLTSEGTASASELIINGLKPYMDVFLIGDVTYGKNVGSIAIEDEENPENNYGLLPIVTQSFNSLDQSDYSTGFEPNITVLEISERLRALGDVNEIMLRTAIEEITGIPSSARVTKLDRVEIANTLQGKIRTGKMIESQIIK